MNLYYEMPWELRTIVYVYGMSIMTAIVYITLKNAVTGREKKDIYTWNSAFLYQCIASSGNGR